VMRVGHLRWLIRWARAELVNDMPVWVKPFTRGETSMTAEAGGVCDERMGGARESSEAASETPTQKPRSL
jgi:hypothetical protein